MPRKFFWRLYILCAGLALACIAAMGLATHHYMTASRMARLERELTAQAQLIAHFVERDLGTDDAKVADAINNLGEKSEARITVILPDGRVVGESDRDPAELENHSDRTEIAAALKDGVGMAKRESPTLRIEMMYVAVRVGATDAPKGTVRCALPMTDVDNQMAGLTRIILLCGAFGMALALAISFAVSLRITRPISHMTEVATDIAAGRFERKAYVESQGEIGALATALNTMRARLVEQIRRIERDRGELETVLGTMVEGVVAIDARQRVVFLNDTATESLGTSREAAHGRPLWEINRNPALMEIVESAMQADCAKTAQWRSGERQYDITIVPVSGKPGDEDGPSHILVVHDVTSLRKLERMRMDFIANVSHELKSPLTAIRGFVETLREGALDDRARAMEFLEIIDRHSVRLDNLVADLLQLSALEAPDFKLEFSAVSLKDVAERAAESLAAKAAEKKIAISVAAAPTMPYIQADRGRLDQVFSNLLDNAIKYSTEGDSIDVKIEQAGDSAQVEVRDTGIGIPTKDLPRIFERFYRVDKARSREVGGTGLGLAIVKHIVLQHGGAISAQSTVGKGTSIVLTLPIDPRG